MEIPEVARRIKEIKNQYGLTNEELAELSGVPISNISKLLAGIIRNPTVDTVAKIASSLHVSMDYLVGGKESRDHRATTLKEYQILQQAHGLNESGKDELLKFGKLLQSTSEYRREK